MPVSAEVWREFMEGPIWKEILADLEAAEKVVVKNLCSDTELRIHGIDNFPQIKFERGKYHAIKLFQIIPQLMMEDKDAQGQSGLRRELIRNERGTDISNNSAARSRRVQSP